LRIRRENIKKQLVIIGIIVLIIYVGLSGCEGYDPIAQNDRQKIVGTWRAELGNMTLMTLTFTHDVPPGGDLKINGFYDGTWGIDTDGHIDIVGWTNETNYNYFNYHYKFSIDYNTLIFEDLGTYIDGKLITNIITVYTRQ